MSFGVMSKVSSPNTAWSRSTRTCSVSHKVSGHPVTSLRVRQVVDQVALLDAVLLALLENTADEAQAILDRRRDAHLVAVLLIPILALDELARDRSGRPALSRLVDPVSPSLHVVEERVVGVVRLRGIVALQERARISDIEVADLALYRHRRLCPLVDGLLGIPVRTPSDRRAADLPRRSRSPSASGPSAAA